MFKYLTNSYTAHDGGSHSAAVVAVSRLAIMPIKGLAYVEVSYFHDLTKALADIPIQPVAVYEFLKNPPFGKHDFDAVFIPGQNQSENLFNYIKSLPEFVGWSVI